MGRITRYITRVYSEGEGEYLIPKSEPWSVLFVGRVFGIPLARGFARLPIRIHPNILTVSTVPLAIVAAYYFYSNMLVLGALFYFLWYIIDCTDGTLARLTNTQSKTGARIDYYSDFFNNIIMYFGLWYSQYYLVGDWFLGGCIIAAHYFIMVFGYVFLEKLTYKTISPRIHSYYIHADEGFLTFFVAPISGFFRIIFPVLVGLQLVSYLILFATQKNRPDIKGNIKKMLKLE